MVITNKHRSLIPSCIPVCSRKKEIASDEKKETLKDDGFCKPRHLSENDPHLKDELLNGQGNNKKLIESTKPPGKENNKIYDSLSDTIFFGNPYSDRSQDKISRGIVGKISNQFVTLDLQYGKTIAIFGKPGSGKSYLAGVLTEMMAIPCKNMNYFEKEPSAVVVFNFRPEINARFEYSSYVHTNRDHISIKKLKEEYDLDPQSVSMDNILVCAHNTMIRERQNTDYKDLNVRQLSFCPESLNADDWLLLMGLTNDSTLYAKILKDILEELYLGNRLNLVNLENEIDTDNRLENNQRKLARVRLSFIRKYISNNGIHWNEIVRPGQITILDFRREFLPPADVLRLALISLRGVGGVDRNICKFVLLDEFHAYYDLKFSDEMDKYTRMVRHQSLTLCIASQNAERIDKRILQSFTNKFIFNVESTTWEKLIDADPALKRELKFEDIEKLPRESGECFIKFDECSVDRYCNKPKKLEVRPRLTMHGGATAS